MTETILPISPDVFWPIASLLGFVALTVVLFAILPNPANDEDAPLEQLKRRMGLTGLNSGVLFVGILFWGLLFVTLFASLIVTVFHAVSLALNHETDSTIRGDVILIAGFTATLGAVVALPFTLVRIALTREQNAHAEDVLFNDKIASAADDLHARREIREQEPTDGTPRVEFIEDDQLKRTVAIDRLEGLARERPNQAPRIARMLCVYLRELSKVIDADREDLPRADMLAAAQTLGRLRKHDDALVIDLRDSNLQKMALRELDFEGALLNGAQLQWAHLVGAQLQGAYLVGAQLQRAYLVGAQLQRANLYEAQLQGAYLGEAQLQGAHLVGAQLQGANLVGAQLQGAYLSEAQMDETTLLNAAILRGAALRRVNYTDVNISQDQIDSLFGDDTVTLPNDIAPPERFSRSYDNWSDFQTAWREFQQDIRQDPENPE